MQPGNYTLELYLQGIGQLATSLQSAESGAECHHLWRWQKISLHREDTLKIHCPHCTLFIFARLCSSLFAACSRMFFSLQRCPLLLGPLSCLCCSCWMLRVSLVVCGMPHIFQSFFVFSFFSACFDKAMSFRKSILSAEHKAGTCYDCDILLKRCI